MENKITNLEYLDSICDGDPEFKKDLIQTFLTNSPKLMIEIKADLESKKWKKVGDNAHSLKPSFDLMGMKDHKDIVLKIEKYGRENKNLDELPALIDKLEEVINKACEELKQASTKIS